jgi:endonuclease/exonuclease/phosphatase family metal-dependent hydrolase
VKESATENTARIIGLLQTDIICVVDAENRIGLKRFNEDVLAHVEVAPFQHIMLIDGNDDRGIDVGIMTRDGFNITRMLSHVDDADAEGIIFSRDCPEYEISAPNGNQLLLLINHLKSKGFGKIEDSNAKRTHQTKQLRKIYDAKRADYDFIAIIGDLNENPDLPPMDALLREGSDLTDIMTHPNFVGDGRPGTFGYGTASGKLDYILLSPKLADKVIQGGIERRGVWGGTNGKLFSHLPTVKSAKDAASDHAALWAELDI